MKTILPNGYAFTQNDNLTPLSKAIKHVLEQPIWYFLLLAVASLVIGFILLSWHKNILQNKLQSKIVAATYATINGLMLLISLITGCLLFVSMNNHLKDNPNQAQFDTDLTKPLIYPYQIKTDFRFKPHSNLVIRQVLADRPLTTDKQQKRNYALYLKQAPERNIYVGQTKKQQFVFAKNTAGTALKTYANYIKQKHLEDKFKHTMYLKPYDNIVSASDQSQYELQGNHITLRLLSKQKKQVYQIKNR